jgi:hypothetical protein
LPQREGASEGFRCKIAPDLASHAASQVCVDAVVVPLEDLAEPHGLGQRIADHGTVVGLHAATSFPLGRNGFRETLGWASRDPAQPAAPSARSAAAARHVLMNESARRNRITKRLHVAKRRSMGPPAHFPRLSGPSFGEGAEIEKTV